MKLDHRNYSITAVACLPPCGLLQELIRVFEIVQSETRKAPHGLNFTVTVANQVDQ
jgi:hypothetical protein